MVCQTGSRGRPRGHSWFLAIVTRTAIHVCRHTAPGAHSCYIQSWERSPRCMGESNRICQRSPSRSPKQLRTRVPLRVAHSRREARLLDGVADPVHGTAPQLQGPLPPGCSLRGNVCSSVLLIFIGLFAFLLLRFEIVSNVCFSRL